MGKRGDGKSESVYVIVIAQVQHSSTHRPAPRRFPLGLGTCAQTGPSPSGPACALLLSQLEHSIPTVRLVRLVMQAGKSIQLSDFTQGIARSGPKDHKRSG